MLKLYATGAARDDETDFHGRSPHEQLGSCYDAIMRYFFAAPTSWSLEINSLLLVYLAVVGTPMVYPYALLPIGFGALALQFLIETCQAAYRLAHPAAGKETSNA